METNENSDIEVEQNQLLYDTIAPHTVKIKIILYQGRWSILFLYCLYSCVNFAQYMQYSIITNIVVKYYNIDIFDVSWTTNVFMISYIILFIPVSYLMERYDLRQVSIAISFSTTLGVFIKLFSIHPDKYYLVLIGQSFCAIAQVFMMSIPSKLAAVWFGKDEVSLACAYAVGGTQLGLAVGCFVPPYVVDNHDEVDLIGNEMYYMMVYNLVVSVVSFLLTFLFFRAKPITPPNPMQLIPNKTEIEYFKSLKNLIFNRDYLVLLLVVALSYGLWMTYGIVFNTIYLNYFPEGEEDAGLISLLSIIAGGVFGSIIFGIILDKTHRFKLTTFTIILLSAILYTASSFALEEVERTYVFVTQILTGFFLNGSLAVGLEYAIELTCPEPESTTLAFLNAVSVAFALIFVVILDGMFTVIGFFWTNIMIAAVLAFCSFNTLLISNNLRRQNVNNSTPD